MTRRLRRALLVFVLAALGCAGEPAARPVSPSYLLPQAFSCPAVNPHEIIARPAPLSADFRPVTVALCTFRPVVVASPEGLSGGWLWGSVRRSEGPFDPLTRALRTAPAPRLGDRICTPNGRETIYLALTDAAGRTVVPAIPLDGCGAPLASIDRAVAGMAWRTIESR